MDKKHLLLVEDDETLGYVLTAYLELKNFEVTWVQNGQLGLRKFKRNAFDLCLLDIMMPEKDGFWLANEIKKMDDRMPLIFLTARTLKVDKLKGFELGADDYIVKPIDEEELVARINAVLRRAQSLSLDTEKQQYQIGSYSFDYSNLQLSFQEEHRQLTEREGQLLKLLCQHKGRLLPRKLVLKTLWRNTDYFTRRSMDVFISRLRKYLAADPAIKITNIYGNGFILNDEVAD